MTKGAKEKDGRQQVTCTVMLELESRECIVMTQLLFITQENNSYKTGNVMYIYRNLEGLSRNHCYRGKIRIIHSECKFIALVNQLAKCMSRIILSSVVCRALPCFSTLSINGTIL